MFRFASLRPVLRPTLVFLAGFVVAAVASAQVPAPKPPPQPAVDGSRGADLSVIIANINDLGLLHALLPLKLTAPEISALKDVFAKIIVDDKTRLQQDADGLRALAAGVERTRTLALAGEPIPAELEARVAAAAKAAQNRERTTRSSAIQRVLVVVKQTFTPEQQKQMADQAMKVPGGKRVPREYALAPKKAPASMVQDLAVAFFIEKVLLNDRAPQVINALKPAAAPEAATGGEAAAAPAKPGA